jgi:hypothetical protein
MSSNKFSFELLIMTGLPILYPIFSPCQYFKVLILNLAGYFVLLTFCYSFITMLTYSYFLVDDYYTRRTLVCFPSRLKLLSLCLLLIVFLLLDLLGFIYFDLETLFSFIFFYLFFFFFSLI